MKTNLQRINNIIGQLEGVKKMLAEEDRQQDCGALIIQLKAVKSAMASLMEKVIADEFNVCLLDKKKNSEQSIKKIFKELINN